MAMDDLIGLGPANVPGEVVAISDGQLTVQAYEYTGGLTPGDAAVPQGGPLSAPLSPGLLGGVFDGLLRPLTTAPTWLGAGADGVAGWAAAAGRGAPAARAGPQRRILRTPKRLPRSSTRFSW